MFHVSVKKTIYDYHRWHSKKSEVELSAILERVLGGNHKFCEKIFSLKKSLEYQTVNMRPTSRFILSSKELSPLVPPLPL